MAMNVYARNRMVALKTAAKKTGLTYEAVKAAYNQKTKLEDAQLMKAVNIAHAILRNYGKAMKAVQNTAPVEENAVAVEVAVETAE